MSTSLLRIVAWSLAVAIGATVAAFAFFGGVPARLVPENVARHIFRVLCPAALCDQW